MANNMSNFLNAKDLAVEAAHEALRLYKQEEKDKRKKAALRNTGLVMDYYLELVGHCEKIKYKASDIQDELGEEDIDINLDEIVIGAIKKSKIKTKIMISAIESSVRSLENDMKEKKESEKYEVIKKLYMDDSKKNIKFNQKIQMVAEEMNCSDSSVRRWNNEMLNKLSVKIFGQDGLKLDIWAD